MLFYILYLLHQSKLFCYLISKVLLFQYFYVFLYVLYVNININCLYHYPFCLNCIDKPSVKQNLRIRKLTPREVWRLMGFDDADFEKASKVNSNTQLYKQAGNSIVVNVLEAILNNLLNQK